jgi:hypothetical protein
MIIKKVLSAIIIFFWIQNLIAQPNDTIITENGTVLTPIEDSLAENKLHRNAIELCPFVEVNILQYNRTISANDQLIFGFIYYNPSVMNAFEYPGDMKSFSVEIGYRRFLWKNLNFEFDVVPSYVSCYEANEEKTYNGLNLVSELRIGYQFDFSILKNSFFINFQFFGGYYFLDSRPQSFVDIDKANKLYPFYVSPVPIIFFGMRI